jgi:glycosyltransferase involved in cell wall biosynthesis
MLFLKNTAIAAVPVPQGEKGVPMKLSGSQHIDRPDILKIDPGAIPVALTLFVACYNEEENIEITLDALLGALIQMTFTWEILIIDDASTDKSTEIIRGYQSRHPGLPIHLIVNERNRGLGHNYEAAAVMGRGAYYRLICGDNSEPTETFVKVFQQLGQADIIIPYHGDVPGKSLFRRKLSRTYTTLVNLISGYRLQYYNGLAVHLRENVIRCRTNSGGFGFQADILTQLLDEGATYIEVPVHAQERQKGQSKVLTLKNLMSVGNTLLTILGRRIKRIFKRSTKLAPGITVPADQARAGLNDVSGSRLAG